jgi:hypothetical protein
MQQFKVINSGDEIKSEREASSSVSVSIRDNLKALEFADDVFVERPLTS